MRCSRWNNITTTTTGRRDVISFSSFFSCLLKILLSPSLLSYFFQPGLVAVVTDGNGFRELGIWQGGSQGFMLRVRHRRWVFLSGMSRVEPVYRWNFQGAASAPLSDNFKTYERFRASFRDETLKLREICIRLPTLPKLHS